MREVAADHEMVLRIAAFLAVLAAVGLWEALAPHRPAAVRSRQGNNLALLAVDIAVLRVLAPGAAIAVAFMAEERGWGLLNTWAPSPWIGIPIAVAFLDLVIYFQHVAFHAVPALWRLHRVHHSDPEVDVTTALRFHPVEILLSTGIKCAAVAAIGAPVVAVLAFELILNAMAMFNHANVALPGRLERTLRRALVTPEMHRIHHSREARDQAANFGFNLSAWDRLLGTYRPAAQAGPGFPLGVDDVAPGDAVPLARLLAQPWLEPPAAARAKAAGPAGSA